MIYRSSSLKSPIIPVITITTFLLYCTNPKDPTPFKISFVSPPRIRFPISKDSK
jgi:hypothetical protein